jgi:hypothetical protein
MITAAQMDDWIRRIDDLSTWGEDALEELREVRDDMRRAYLVQLGEEVRAETRPLVKCK